MKQIILAFYDTIEQAHDAVNDLVRNGHERSDIGLAVNDTDQRYAPYLESEDVDSDEGAGFGAVVGGLTGIVAGLTAITIPGVGPVIAAGPLAAALGGLTGGVIGAATGAAAGGLTAWLVDMGVPDEHADYYAEGVRRGGALVSVTTEERMLTTAANILRQHNPVDIEQRAVQWKKNEGWTGFDHTAEPYTAEERARMAETDVVTYDVNEVDYDEVDDNRVRWYPPVNEV